MVKFTQVTWFFGKVIYRVFAAFSVPLQLSFQLRCQYTQVLVENVSNHVSTDLLYAEHIKANSITQVFNNFPYCARCGTCDESIVNRKTSTIA